MIVSIQKLIQTLLTEYGRYIYIHLNSSNFTNHKII